MLSDLSSPVLSLAADVVKDLEGEVAVYGLWSVFTKCKNSVQDGRRLENLSWRLWHREMSTSTTPSNIPPPSASTEVTPSSDTDLPVLVPPSVSPVLGTAPGPLPKGVPSPTIHPLTLMPSFDTIASPRARSLSPAGKIICDILPEKITLPPRQPLPLDVPMCTIDIASPSPAPSTTLSTFLAPTTSTAGVPPFPKVIIVNPTPHPTPPATPLSSHQVHHNGLNPISHIPSHLTPTRTPGLVSATPKVDPSAGSVLAVPHRLQVLPPHLSIPPQYAPRPPTSQLAQRHVSSIRPPATTPKHVTVPEFPSTGQPVLSHQSRFFFRESPEQIDSSPDRAGSALGRVGSEDKSNNGDNNSEIKVSLTETVQGAASERSDSLDGDVSVHPSKALTAASSSVGSRDSKRSTSLPRNKKSSATNAPSNNTGAATRRKAGHQVAARTARPMTTRMNSRTTQHKRTKSNSNVPMAANLAVTRTTSRRSDTGPRADSKDRVKGPPSPITPVQPNETPTDTTTTVKQPGRSTPTVKRRGNSTNSHEGRLSTGEKVDHHHPSRVLEEEPQIAQSQRRGIVAEDDDSSSDSEFETGDSDDSEWASEEISQVEDKPPSKANGRTSGKDKKKAEGGATRRVREVVEGGEQERRDREMFAKLPRKSYTNLPEGVPGVGGVENLYGPPRTKSGLLTQLLNPDPAIFPVNHPYRTSFSSQDVTAYSRMNPALSMARVQAAMPQATRAQVTVNNYPTTQLNGAGPSDLRNGSKYRPRPRPDGAEMDDSDGEDDNNKLEVSTSLAQQRLAALVGPGRRGFSRKKTSDSQPQLSSNVINHRVVDHTNAVNPNNVTPIPLHHPYNLPPPTAPSTPRTTRRHMLSTELSESLRRNLLWERQVSKVGGQPYQRRPVSALNPGIRPLTSVNESQASGSGSGDTDGPKPESKEERRKKALDRNRSWADEYHYSGW